MKEIVLELTGVTKRYKQFTLGPLDVQVEKGTVVALIGPNGSGKSTLFKLIMNLLQPEQGEINLFGQRLTDKEVEAKQKIGFVGEQYTGLAQLTIKELASLIARWYPTWDDEYYNHLLERYELDKEQIFLQCSTGNQKKVEFIFSLAHNPDLLLLDEPTRGVDILSQRKMKEDMLNYLESGQKSILIATHIIDEVKHLGDYVYVLDQGQGIYASEKDDLQDKWARIWVSNITESIKEHPHVLASSETPYQVVTDHLQELEKTLAKESIKIIQVQRLSLEEIIEYLIEKIRGII